MYCHAMDMLVPGLIFVLFCFVPPSLGQINLCLTNSATGELVYRINETDTGPLPNMVLDMTRDVLGSQNQIALTLIDNPGEFFTLQGKQLRLAKSIDRDSTGLNSLNLRLVCAYTVNGLPAQREIPITVIIDDVNDNQPIFLGTPYAANISELTPVGEVVFSNIRTTDADMGINSQLEYSVVRNAGTPPNAADFFAITNPLQPVVTLLQNLDYESMRQFQVVIVATDRPGSPTDQRRSATATLTVNVLDEADLAPTFEHPNCRTNPDFCTNVDYRAEIRAGVLPTTQLVSIQPASIRAHDVDSMRFPVVYGFGNGTPADFAAYFSIDSSSGDVRQLQAVPYGAADRFVITVLAQESGGSNLISAARLLIDVNNDIRNEFDPALQTNALVGYIEEGSPVGTTVRVSAEVGSEPLQVLVEDQDLQPGMPPATYQYILTDRGAAVFAINQGGYVYVNIPNLDVDNQNPAAYNLTIQAREVNTNPVRSSQPITLVVNILDINDMAPTFVQAVNNIKVAASQGTREIYRIKATDGDAGVFGNLSHRIVSVTNGGEGLFRYDSDRGAIMSTDSLIGGSQYQVVLEARDGGGRTAQAVVVVDVDPDPIVDRRLTTLMPMAPFPAQENTAGLNVISVSEGVPPNTVITQLVATGAAGALSYSIVAGNEEGKFYINSTTGAVYTIATLDFEQRQVYNLVVQAVDGTGLSNTTTLTVAVEDEIEPVTFGENASMPFFQQTIYNVEVREDVGSVIVVTVRAVAQDPFAPVTYVLRQGDPTLFAIDSQSGAVSTRRALDAEQSRTHTLIVGTQENTQRSASASATVSVNVVDVNDWIPVFNPPTYSAEVSNMAPMGTPVVRVSAGDQDLTAPNNIVEYSLTGRDAIQSYFQVAADTGLITTARSLQQLTDRNIVLFVEARDRGSPPLSSTATVSVQLLMPATSFPTFPTFPTPSFAFTTQGFTAAPSPFGPLLVQFSSPEYRVSVSEAVVAPFMLQVLPVVNKPFNPTAIQCNIMAGNFGGGFGIFVNQRGDCELRVVSNGSLDRETVSSYILNVSVSGTDQVAVFSFATVVVDVMDFNDNGPVFRFNYYDTLGLTTFYGALGANEPPLKSDWLVIQATDADAGSNGMLSYSLNRFYPDSENFRINNVTGSLENLVTLQDLTRKEPAYFRLGVEAKDNPDQGIKAFEAQAEVIINAIRDENRVVLVLKGLLPERARTYAQDITRAIQARSGACNVVGIEKWLEDKSSSTPGTEVWLYMVNSKTNLICSRDDASIRALMSEPSQDYVRGQLASYFTVDSMRPPSRVASAGVTGDDWGAAQIALIVLACVIAVGCIVGIIVMCYFWSRYKKSRVYASQQKPNLYAMLPKTYNALLLPPSEKEYETQMLEMAMGEDAPSKDGLDLGFTVHDGVYSIRPAASSSHVYHTTNGNQRSNGGVVIPPPDYPTANAGHMVNGRRPMENGRRNAHDYPPRQGGPEKTTML